MASLLSAVSNVLAVCTPAALYTRNRRVDSDSVFNSIMLFSLQFTAKKYAVDLRGASYEYSFSVAPESYCKRVGPDSPASGKYVVHSSLAARYMPTQSKQNGRTCQCHQVFNLNVSAFFFSIFYLITSKSDTLVSPLCLHH